jgi:predicted Kef-type K+ transport protein
LKDVLVFLAAAGLVVPLFHRARIGAVLGFLCVGIAVGPQGFGRLAEDFPWVRYLTIEDRDRVEPFAELGVLFLLFVIGLELSLPRLWSLRRYVAGIGGLQFALSALAIGAGLAVLGVPGSGAIVLGLCLAMSSTAIVMQLLEEQGRSTTPVGRIALAVLLFQDLMVAPVLFGVQILARGEQNAAVSLAAALLQAVLAVVAILAAGRYVLQPIFRFAAQTGSRDLIMAITLFMVVGVAAATGVAGLSTALGASRGSSTVRDRIPPPGRNRYRAVQGALDRPVLHLGWDDHRHRRGVGPYRPRPRRGRGFARGQEPYPAGCEPRVRCQPGGCRRGRDPAGAGRRVRVRRHRSRSLGWCALR